MNWDCFLFYVNCTLSKLHYVYVLFMFVDTTVTSVEVTCSEAMLALSFSTLLVKCMMKILGGSALG